MILYSMYVQLGANLALLNMEGLNLEYKKVAVEALSGSHTVARHTHFFASGCL